MEQKKRRGRPKKDLSEVKRHNVTIAMADPTRKAIGEAAEKSGRSISSEIDYRLGMTFELERDTGSASVRRLIDFVRLAATKLMDEMGADWTEDGEVVDAIFGAIGMYLRENTKHVATERTKRLQAHRAALVERTERLAEEAKTKGEQAAGVEEAFKEVIDSLADITKEFVSAEDTAFSSFQRGVDSTADLRAVLQIKPPSR